MISPKLKVIEVVSNSVEKALYNYNCNQDHSWMNEEERVDIAMEVCDEVIRILYPRKDYISPHDPGDEHQEQK
tara:strand:+ start:923 stop:1141 length:219 start_codon:yes stop_codon:yes gene_type:complete